MAPAVKVGEEIVVEGKGINEDEFEAAIRRHLGLPVEGGSGKKGLLGRILGS